MMTEHDHSKKEIYTINWAFSAQNDAFTGATVLVKTMQGKNKS